MTRSIDPGAADVLAGRASSVRWQLPDDCCSHQNHVMSGRSTLGDADALQMTGRTVEITASSYKSPWHGTCDDAVHERRERLFADILTEADLNGEARQTAIHFGFGDPIEQYELSCGDNHRVPGLVIYISGDRAMTCFAGVCYLLAADKK